jgi:hypothetical protein
MSIWYFYYPKRFSFSPLDYETGLGGGEGSLVVLTEALAQTGHRVEVFNCCYRPGTYRGVTWHMAWEIDNAPPPDVLVSVRFEEAIGPDLSAKHRLYWMLDDRWRGAMHFLDLFGKDGGRIVVASQAMRKVLEHHGNIMPTLVQEIPLPVRAPLPIQAQARSLACLYCSVPNRGLDVLLTLWPQIIDAVPEAQLWITSGYQLWGYTNEEAEDRMRQSLGAWQPHDSITYFGILPKQRLSELQASCAFLLYPCRFPEMFCLSAAECTAVGTPIITSAQDALRERVFHGKNGYLIEGAIDTAHTQQQFVRQAVALLRDPTTRASMSGEALKLAKTTSPESIAAQWERLVSE